MSTKENQFQLGQFFFHKYNIHSQLADLSNIHETTITPFPYSTAASTRNRKNWKTRPFEHAGRSNEIRSDVSSSRFLGLISRPGRPL